MNAVDSRFDLWIALAVVVVLAIMAFRLVGRCEFSKRGRILVPVVLVVAIVAFDRWLRDSPWIIQVLPFTSVPVLGNLLLPLAGGLAGCLWQAERIPRWRRGLLVALLAAFCLTRYVPLLRHGAPACADAWRDGVCLQTTSANCGAAATATLLKTRGIESNERVMAELCLTDAAGTTFHGMYRGLRYKTTGQPFKVQALHQRMGSLPNGKLLPALLVVRLNAATDSRDPRYSRDWGWVRDVPHVVVLYRILPEGKVEVGDPSFGRERWDVQSIHDLWTGDLLCLRPVGK